MTDDTTPGPGGSLSIVSGTADDGPGATPRFRPFLTVTLTEPDGSTIPVGQMDPMEVRQLALDWLAAAEAAEQDSMLFSVLTQRVELPVEVAAQVVASMRAYRMDPADRVPAPWEKP